MKYSIGDKVRVKGYNWYIQMLSIPDKVVWQNKLSEEFVGIWCGSKIFYEDMCKFCANIMTIQNVGNDYYIMEEDSCGHEFNDEMLEGKVEKRPIMMKYKKGDKVRIKDKIEDDWFYRGQDKEEVYIPQVIKDGISEGCGKVMTIAFVSESQKLYMMEEHWGHAYTDEMIECLVESDSLMEKNNILPVADPLYAYDNRVELNDGRSGIVDKSWWDDDEKCYMYIVSIGRGDCDVVKESELKMSGDIGKFHIGDRITDGKNHLIITKVLSDRYIVVDRLNEMGELYFSSQDNWRYDTDWMYDGNLVAERFSDDKEVPKFKVGDKITNGKIIIDVVGIDNGKYIIKDAEGVFGMLCFSVQGEWDIVKEKGESIKPKFKVGDKICRVLCGLSNGYLVTSVSDEYYGLLMGEGNVGVLPIADQDEWVLLSAGDKKIEGLVEEANKLDADAFSDGYDQGYDDGQHDMNEWKLPDGFEFRDGDGNLIAVDKIVLVKKRARYPQSFEECCEVLSMPSYYKLRYSTYEHGYHEYTTSKELGVLQSELDTLGKLLICRDAYWLTAGREMGLEGMWEPDWSDCRKFAIFVEGNEILTDVCLRRNRILVFPTEEMRDEFLKVFRNYIEECKEFL